MSLALYHPAYGYYGGSPPRVGREGDFFTAVSVGPLYGRLLAQVAMETWERLGRPEEFIIAEQGAHDGQLAADIWAGLLGHPLAQAARYLIIEPQAGYRQAQWQRLVRLLGDHIFWGDHISVLDLYPHALLLCNELLDAFPVHQVRWNGGAWEELGVNEALEFTARPILSPEVQTEVARLPTDLSAGYTTEVHPAAARWLRAVASCRFQGALMIADYGYEQADYYAPERCEGTLRRYHQHKVDGELLRDLGQSDLTAHINFTQVIEEAAKGGFSVRRFMEQGRFLTHAAAPWLGSLEGKLPSPETMGLLRQFHTLTHPSHMGSAFRMLLMERGLSSRPT